jgi:hypothetical protein
MSKIKIQKSNTPVPQQKKPGKNSTVMLSFSRPENTIIQQV